mmetsp:Transcript_5069/g.8301  ORF Transcript_5069/g.8301 Transcript_5069/m.8301 type:complete len:115 (-) Transcript_5069:88-432(-)
MSVRKSTSPSSSMQSMHTEFVPRPRAPLLVRYPPIRTTIAGILMLVGGIFFLTFGLVVIYTHFMKHGQSRGLAMVALGAMLFLPGSYATTVILGTWLGWEGYDYSQLPSYDELG